MNNQNLEQIKDIIARLQKLQDKCDLLSQSEGDYFDSIDVSLKTPDIRWLFVDNSFSFSIAQTSISKAIDYLFRIISSD